MEKSLEVLGQRQNCPLNAICKIIKEYLLNRLFLIFLNPSENIFTETNGKMHVLATLSVYITEHRSINQIIGIVL